MSAAGLRAVLDPNGPKPVHEAWVDVMTAVQSIGKGDRNTDQNFNFRGIDATLNAVGPALRDARVFVRPRRILDRSEERYETKRGTQMRNVTLTIEWEITGPAGDSMLAESCGEAADSGDKAVSKAHSVAYRTLLLQALAVPTGDRDPDAESHERATAQGPDPRAEGWRAIESKGVALGLNPGDIRDDYRAKQGHEIDGPEATPDTLRDYYRQMGGKPAEPAVVELPLPDPDGAGYDPMGLDGGDK